MKGGCRGLEVTRTHGDQEVRGSKPSGGRVFSQTQNLFISHRFNSWMTDLLLSEDLGEIIQEG